MRETPVTNNNNINYYKNAIIDFTIVFIFIAMNALELSLTAEKENRWQNHQHHDQPFNAKCQRKKCNDSKQMRTKK